MVLGAGLWAPRTPVAWYLSIIIIANKYVTLEFACNFALLIDSVKNVTIHS